LINKIRIHKIIKAQITIQALQNQFIIITIILILILIITIILITIINQAMIFPHNGTSLKKFTKTQKIIRNMKANTKV